MSDIGVKKIGRGSGSGSWCGCPCTETCPRMRRGSVAFVSGASGASRWRASGLISGARVAPEFPPLEGFALGCVSSLVSMMVEL